MKKTLVAFSLICIFQTQLSAQPQSWKELPFAPFKATRHESVFFVSSKTGWVVNLDGQIWKTADGGKTWKLQFTAQAGFRSVAFADSLRGWVGALTGLKLWETSDGGLSWTAVNPLPAPEPQGICAISVVDNSVVYASGRFNGPAIILKSTDRGRTWDAIDMSAHASVLIDNYFFSPDSGIVVGGTPGGIFPDVGTVILSTSNGGTTWETRYSGTRPQEWGWKISFPHPDTGFVALETFSEDVYVLKTVDRGLTWQEKFLGKNLDVQGIGFINGHTGWVGSDKGNTGNPYFTADGGETWQAVDFGRNINRIHVLSKKLAFAVGQTVYKYSDEPIFQFTDAGAGFRPLINTQNSMAWGDYDRDGDYDLLLCGQNQSGLGECLLYRNDAGSFVEVNASLAGIDGGTVRWGDYDNDGDLDILQFGQSDTGEVATIYENNNGDFIAIEHRIHPFGFGPTADWIDFDNDGDLDIFAAGQSNMGPQSSLFRNDEGEFTEVQSALTGVFSAASAWGDYDKDGDFDLLLSGATSPGNVPPLIRIYENRNGVFDSTDFELAGVDRGAADWGDYDGDGDLDILLTGRALGAMNEPDIARVYRNDGNTFASIPVSLPRPGRKAVWLDFDNDGALDILLSNIIDRNTDRRGTSVFLNSGAGFEPAFTNLVSTGFGSAALADYDNDGDLDIAITGELSDGSGFVSVLQRNESAVANTLPNAPTGLAVIANADSVVLSWQAGADAQTPATSLSYNLRVGTTPGGIDVVSPMSDITTGFRHIVARGNADLNLHWQLRDLPDGTYYWSVQAIDQGFAGSRFAPEEMFVIGQPTRVADRQTGIPKNYALAQNYPNPFNPQTAIRYALPKAGHTIIKIFDIGGRHVRTLVENAKEADEHTVVWDGKDSQGKTSPSGVYIYRLEAGEFITAKKLVLVR